MKFGHSSCLIEAMIIIKSMIETNLLKMQSVRFYGCVDDIILMYAVGVPFFQSKSSNHECNTVDLYSRV